MADSFTNSERSRIMAAVKSKGTAPEMIVRRLVHRLGFRYRLHVKALPGTPDLVFPSLRKVINVSGCFWHGHGCGRCRIPATRREYWLAKIKRNRGQSAESSQTPSAGLERVHGMGVPIERPQTPSGTNRELSRARLGDRGGVSLYKMGENFFQSPPRENDFLH